MAPCKIEKRALRFGALFASTSLNTQCTRDTRHILPLLYMYCTVYVHARTNIVYMQYIYVVYGALINAHLTHIVYMKFVQLQPIIFYITLINAHLTHIVYM